MHACGCCGGSELLVAVKLFDQLDRNNDGTLTRTEIIKAMRNPRHAKQLGPILGIESKQITQEGEIRVVFEEFFDSVDVDDDSMTEDQSRVWSDRGLCGAESVSRQEFLDYFVVEEINTTVELPHGAKPANSRMCQNCILM